MRRGDIVWVDLDPVRRAEAGKRRPAVIVNNEGAADRCQLANDSKAQAEQIGSVSIDRVGEVIGRPPPDLLEDVDEAIRLHLKL